MADIFPNMATSKLGKQQIYTQLYERKGAEEIFLVQYIENIGPATERSVERCAQRF